SAAGAAPEGSAPPLRRGLRVPASAPARWCRCRRRIRGRTCGGSECGGTVPNPWLIPRDELVQVEKHAAQLHPTGGFGLRHAFQLIGKEGGHGLWVGREPAAAIVEI